MYKQQGTLTAHLLVCTRCHTEWRLRILNGFRESKGAGRARGQNVKRCWCRVSGVRNKCINNRARSPRTCWHPRCPSRWRLRIYDMCTTWLAVFVQPTAPASTYEGRTPSKQPPVLETPPLATSSRKSIMKYKGMRDNPHKRASCRAHSHGGELPRALTPTHGPAAARTHRALKEGSSGS